MGVAVRTYFTSPRHDDDYLESWLELWDRRGAEDRLLPGYGWIFGMGDGTSNVGLGVLNTSVLLQGAGLAGDPQGVVRVHARRVGLHPGEHDRPDPRRGAPHGLQPPAALHPGLLLVGDAGGMVNPFNGEGIAYAMESGQIAAEVIVQAHARATPAQREMALRRYPQILKDTYGGYYTLGRAFVKLIGNPKVMKLATQRGLTHPLLMRFTLKMLANLTDPTGGDAMDRIINGLTKVAPKA